MCTLHLNRFQVRSIREQAATGMCVQLIAEHSLDCMLVALTETNVALTAQRMSTAFVAIAQS